MRFGVALLIGAIFIIGFGSGEVHASAGSWVSEPIRVVSETVESMPAPGETTDPVSEYESIIAFIPLSTGPGVLANLLDVLRDAGLNMTSFISRPIKGRDGTYSFIATIDAAPWQEHLRDVLTQVVDHGDWVKTLAVYPRRERPNPPIYAWSLPNGGVRREPAAPGTWTEGDTARRELLW